MESGRLGHARDVTPGKLLLHVVLIIYDCKNLRFITTELVSIPYRAIKLVKKAI